MSKETWRSLLSPTVCVPGIKLGLLGLMASVFPSQAISPVFEWVLNILKLHRFCKSTEIKGVYFPGGQQLKDSRG